MEDLIMLNKKSIDDINVNGKRVLCRCDFNVPLDGDRITDETRLVERLSFAHTLESQRELTRLYL